MRNNHIWSWFQFHFTLNLQNKSNSIDYDIHSLNDILPQFITTPLKGKLNLISHPHHIPNTFLNMELDITRPWCFYKRFSHCKCLVDMLLPLSYKGVTAFVDMLLTLSHKAWQVCYCEQCQCFIFPWNMAAGQWDLCLTWHNNKEGSFILVTCALSWNKFLPLSNLVFFKKIIIFSGVVLYKCNIFCIRLVQYNAYLVMSVGTVDLMLLHQGIIRYSTEYTAMHFQLFGGWGLSH